LPAGLVDFQRMGQDSGVDLRKGPIYRIGAAALVAVMAAFFVAVWIICLKHTDGYFTYTLDDPYIHLGIAKNMAFHGVWGVTEYGNTSASSSPLWTGLLALTIWVAGDSVYWPLAFGILFSVAATLLIYVRFVSRGMAVVLSVIAATAIFLAGPLHVLPFTGMEHSLQIFLDLLFVFWLVDVLGRKSGSRDLIIAVLLPALMCLSRYESVFVIFVPVIVCLCRREWRLALFLIAGPIVGIGGFALYSHAMGMPAIPNSIMIKGNMPKTTAADFFASIFGRIRALLQAETLTISDLLILAVISGLVLRFTSLRASTGPLRTAIWTAVSACILHASLASFGWFFRYEAYLVVLLATVCILAWREMLAFRGPREEASVTTRAWIAVVVSICAAQFALAKVFSYRTPREDLIILAIVVGGLAALRKGALTRGRLARTVLIWVVPISFYFMIQDRPMLSMEDVPKGSRDIYIQQIQMSRFIARFYPTGRLACNDIGAVTYYSQVHLLDLYGLATDEIRRQKLARKFGTESIGKQIDLFKPDVIIAYPSWFAGDHKFPDSIISVASWIIPPITSAGSSTVTFYATNRQNADQVRRHLQQFQPSLPNSVRVEWYKAPG